MNLDFPSYALIWTKQLCWSSLLYFSAQKKKKKKNDKDVICSR